MKTQSKRTGVNTPQQPEQAAQSEGQALDVQLAELSAEISRIETEIERTARIVKGTPDRLAQAKRDYDSAFLAGNDDGQADAKSRIHEADEVRAAAIAKLRDFAGPLAELRDRQTVLRNDAVEVFTAANTELENLRRAASAANLRCDVVSGLGVKLGGLAASIERYIPVVTSEQSPVESAAPEPAEKPKCPHCGRSDEVVESEPGQFCCQRAFHDRVFFDSTGREIRASSGRQVVRSR